MYEELVYLKDSAFIYKENWVNIVSGVHTRVTSLVNMNSMLYYEELVNKTRGGCMSDVCI